MTPAAIAPVDLVAVYGSAQKHFEECQAALPVAREKSEALVMRRQTIQAELDALRSSQNDLRSSLIEATISGQWRDNSDVNALTSSSVKAELLAAAIKSLRERLIPMAALAVLEAEHDVLLAEAEFATASADVREKLILERTAALIELEGPGLVVQAPMTAQIRAHAAKLQEDARYKRRQIAEFREKNCL